MDKISTHHLYTQIRQGIETGLITAGLATAETTRDDNEKCRETYSMELNQLEAARDQTKLVLKRLTDKATNRGLKVEPNETQ